MLYRIKHSSFLCTIISLIASLALFISPSAVFADGLPPSLPNQFYGTVTINGSIAGANNTVIAKINGVQVESGITDSQGRYGYATLFQVSGTSGQTVEFWVNGIKASQTSSLNPGGITVLPLTVTGSATATLNITTASLAGGIMGTAYLSTIAATGGTGAKTWGMASGSLPAGLTLSTAGVISGTPTTAGTSSFTIQVSDSGSQTATKNYSITISTQSSSTNPLAISTSNLANGTMNTSYSITLAASGGTGTKTWSVVSGTLPAGLTLNSSTGVISGTPTAAMTSNFTIQVTDGSSTTVTKNFSVTIASASTTQATATTISTSVLGAASSFSISNGTVSSPVSISSGSGNVNFSLAGGTAVNLQGSSQLKVTQLASIPASPSNNTKIIAAYSCTPDGATFSPGATISVSYTAADVSGMNENSLQIALLDGSNWMPLTSSVVNTSAKTVTAQVNHFSTYGLMGSLSAGSTGSSSTDSTNTSGSTVTNAAQGLTYSDLSIDPETAAAGNTVTVSLHIANNSKSTVSESVELKINDEPAAQKTVNLQAGKSQLISFLVTTKSSGIYKVEVGGLSSSFTVIGSSQPAESSGGIPWTMIIIAVVGIIVILVIVRLLIIRSRGY